MLMSIRRSLAKACAGIMLAGGLAGFGTSTTDAALVVDLRIGSVLIEEGEIVGFADAENTKAVTAASVGQEIFFGIYAQVRGANTVRNEGLQTLVGNLLSSSGGGVLGHFAPAGSTLSGTETVIFGTAPFNSTGSSNGASQDLDGDGDNDQGSEPSDSGNNFVAIRAGGLQTGAPAPGFGQNLTNPHGREYLVGIGKFIVDKGLSSSATTSVNWAPRTNRDGTPSANSGIWRADAVDVNGATDSYTSGAPILVTGFGGQVCDVGACQENPILPNRSEIIPNGHTRFFYDNVNVPAGGAWFDPPPAVEYLYDIDAPITAEFARIIFPNGFGTALTVSANGVNYGPFGPGDVLNFPDGVQAFRLKGFVPQPDSQDPAGFPLFIQFDTLGQITFTQTAIIPEPASLSVLALGAVGLLARRRRAC
jgi:PEP-CTERM motif